MRSTHRRLALCVASLLAVSGAAHAAEAQASPERFERELARRISGKAPAEDVRVDVRWPAESRYASLRVFGRGLLVCDGRSQVTAPQTTVVSILKDLRDGRFAEMADRYGSDEEEENEGQEKKAPHEGPKLKGSIEVRVGSLVKSVQQLLIGDQSPQLEALAKKLLAYCRDGGATGITISGLDEGLGKVTSGTLAPEMLELTLQRRADKSDGDAGESFLLEIQGRRVTDRPMPLGRMPPAPRTLVLSEADFTTLAGQVAGARPGEIPINVYADRYTEIRGTVLDQTRSIMGRKFAHMTPQTHGERQQAFDRLYETLHALHARVAKQGKPVEPDVAVRGEEEKEKEKEKEKKKEKD